MSCGIFTTVNLLTETSFLLEASNGNSPRLLLSGESSSKNKGIWMSMDSGGNLTDKGMHCQTSSSVEQKLAHQWFVDASEPELLSNKNQAIHSAYSRPIPVAAHMNLTHWDNGSGYESASGQFSDHICGPENTRIFSLVEKNISSLGDGNLNKRKREFDNRFQNDSIVSLPMSKDPNCWNAGGSGVREGLIHEVESSFPISMAQSYNNEEDNTNTMNTTCQRSDGGISLATATGPNFTSADGNFSSLAPTFSKENGNFMLMGYHHNRDDRGFLSMGQNFMLIEHLYGTENGNAMSICPSYNVHGDLVMPGAFCKKEHEHFTPVRTNYDIRAFYFTSGDHIRQKLDVSVASRGITNGEENNLQQLGQGSENGEGAATSSMGFQNRPEGTNHSGYLIPNRDLLLSPSLPEGSEVLTEKSTKERSAYPTVTVAQTNTITVDNVPKQVEKEAKKNSLNNFPSNVKSLLSTGILDGVPVKYVSWSREKSLRGIVRGTGYLCGCDDCKMNKNVNAFEFERHAGCKTKHPNNHIYFVSGKTIYSVVQDLKGTQQEMLFEAIKNITGSPINVKNFRLWKASYQAATRELQRIYGEER